MPASPLLRGSLLALSLGLALLAPVGSAPAQRSGNNALGPPILFKVTDLGEDTGGPVSINNRGAVVIGAKQVGGDNSSFLWSKGTLTRLPARGFVATDISDSGAVAGYALLGRSEDGSPITHAALLNGSRLKDLTPEDTIETRAVSINRAGWVAISSHQGQIYDGSMTRELGQSDGAIDPFVPVEVADNGIVAGNQGPDAYEWKNSNWTELEHNPDYDTAVVKGISSAGGFTCGYATSDGGEDAHALKWRGDKLLRLEEYGARYDTVATAVNDKGNVVGYALKQGTFPSTSEEVRRTPIRVASLRGGYFSPRMDAGVKPLRACLWLGEKNYDLNALITKGSGWTLLAAYEINNSDQIVGLGELKKQKRLFLLTPVK